MDVVDQVAENDLVSSVELASSLIQQLKEAYMKLEAHKDGSNHNLQWEDIENHFHQMESMVKKKLEDLKAKEEDFAKKESEIRRVIAEREAMVAAKEQDLLDHIQDLKDATVAAIVEAQAKHLPESTEPFKLTDENENKVSGSLDVKNAPLHDVGDNTEGLTQSCKLMDANGLLNFIMENLKDLSAVHSQLSAALSSATEPARLVLDLVKRFFSSANSSIRRSCLVIMEALATVLAKADSCVDNNYLNLEIKGQAKGIADEWMAKLGVVEGNDAASENENSLEIEGFLRLVATFRIGSEFDQDKLCKLVLALVHRHRQATELCLSLGLTQKMPGIIEALINDGKLIDAVHLVQAFQLSDAYPPVPLLMAHLKDVRRNTQGKPAKFGRDASLQAVNNTRELTALKSVVQCIKDYNLQADYPLVPLESRITQLQKSKVNSDKKRTNGEVGKYKPSHHQPKKARTNGGFQRHHSGRIGNITRHAHISHLNEGASSSAAVTTTTNAYSYPVASQAAAYAVPETQERYAYANANASQGAAYVVPEPHERYAYANANASQGVAYVVPETQERYAYANANASQGTAYVVPETQERYAYANANASQGGYAAHVGNDQKAYYYVLDDVTRSAGYGVGAPSYVSYPTGGSAPHSSHPHQQQFR